MQASEYTKRIEDNLTVVTIDGKEYPFAGVWSRDDKLLEYIPKDEFVATYEAL